MLLIECPRLLFPFAREIIATATRNGGFPPLLLDPVDFVALYRQRREGLRHRHHLHGVDVDVRGPGRDPVNGIRHIVRRQSLRAFVDGGSPFLVSFEAHFRKFGSADQPRLYVRHPHSRS